MYKTRNPMVDAAFAQTQRPFTRKVIDLTTAITDQLVQLPGDFLYIDQASTGYVTIELNTAQGGAQDPITLAAGGSIECNFANFKITAPAQLNKSVTLIVGNGARIKGGANVNATSMAVSVVDGGTLRTQANTAFTSFVEQTAVAGEYSHMQLYNPADSGKNIFIEQMFFSPASITGFILREYNLPIADEYTYLNAKSKYLGGAASVVEQRVETNAGVIGASAYLAGSNASTEHVTLNLREPMLLAPGKGLLVIATVPNTRVSMTTELYEE